MADSLDLGTLKIKIKAEQNTHSTQNTMKSLGSAFMDAVKNTKVFGLSIGDLRSG